MSDDPLGSWIMVAIALLAAGIAVGALAAVANPDLANEVMDILKETVVEEIKDTEPVTMFTMILANNLQACLLLFLGGASLGILTVFVILTNGLIIGAIVEIVRESRGLLYVSAAIVPHGIFEIPSFVIAGGLGFALAAAMAAEWRGVGDSAEAAGRFGRLFLLIVVPLVVIAAFTEAFITPQILFLVT
jgi:stage II sporulation protein M